jgi:hypothetical protein
MTRSGCTEPLGWFLMGLVLLSSNSLPAPLSQEEVALYNDLLRDWFQSDETSRHGSCILCQVILSSPFQEALP